MRLFWTVLAGGGSCVHFPVRGGHSWASLFRGPDQMSHFVPLFRVRERDSWR